MHVIFQLPIIIPAVLFVLLGVLTVIPLVLKPVSTGVGIALVLGTGIPYYIICVAWKPRVPVFDRFYGNVVSYFMTIILFR